MENSITAIIVDDESDSREVLESLIRSNFPEIEIVGNASDVKTAHELILRTNPQLVFLDIQMPQANGFNLLTKFSVVPFEVVFVTSYDQYAINAIRFNALDYILKPVSLKDLTEAVRRSVEKIQSKTGNTLQIVNLLDELGDSSNKKLAVHSGKNVKILPVNEIITIEGDGRYCMMETTNSERYSMTKTLKDFEDYFGTGSAFIRINKRILINTAHIKEYSKSEPFYVEMSNGKMFEIPRRKKTGILQRLGLFK